jgi:hypothetical protein
MLKYTSFAYMCTLYSIAYTKLLIFISSQNNFEDLISIPVVNEV